MGYNPIHHRFLFMAMTSGGIAPRINRELLRCGGRAQVNPHHLTLAALDDLPFVPAGLVGRLCDAGSAVEGQSFSVVLDRVVATPSSVALRPSHPPAQLRRLRKAIVEAMRSRGIKQRKGYQFSPHVTLSYRNGQPFSRLIDGFGWIVDEFILVDSRVGRSRYEVLGRWKLGDRGEAQYRLL